MPLNQLRKTLSPDSKIDPKQGCGYALPFIITTFLSTPVWTALPGIYAKYFGLSLSVIAAVMFVGRLFDAITDPLIGYWSDYYYAKRASRKPFIVIGGCLFMVSSYFLYVPPDNVDALYFLLWSLLFYFSWTLFEIPHLTWGGELSADPIQRNTIYSYRAVGGYLGLLLFYAIPQLPVFSSAEIVPATLYYSVMLSLLLFPFCLFACVKWVPDGVRVRQPQSPAGEKPANKSRLIIHLINCAISNKPLIILLLAYSCYGLGVGLWYGLIFIFVDAYLMMGEQFAPAFMLSFAMSIPLVPVWAKIAKKIGKKSSWLIANLFFIVACFYTGCLEPGKTSFYQLLLLKFITDLGFLCIEIIPLTMLVGVVDYSRWKFKVDNQATFFSLFVFFRKISLALGAALGLWIISVYGFDPALTEHSQKSVQGLKLAIVIAPTLFFILSFLFVLLFPINESRQAIITRRVYPQ